jgi:hypothetical protein
VCIQWFDNNKFVLLATAAGGNQFSLLLVYVRILLQLCFGHFTLRSRYVCWAFSCRDHTLMLLFGTDALQV